MLLDGRYALVTGASRGIGRAIALRLAAEGAAVALNFAGNVAAAEAVRKEIESAGGKAILVPADVADETAATEMVEKTVEAFGAIDILVNNAGITRDSLLLRMKEEDWDAVLNTNLKGVFHCSKAAAKFMMKKRYGRIVNLASVVGLVGNSCQANYAAAKAGVIGFTKALAKELAGRGITANAITPGFIRSDMTDVLPDKVKETMLAGIPLGRAGEPEDVAKAALFLASDQAAYITGQVLTVDGGMVM